MKDLGGKGKRHEMRKTLEERCEGKDGIILPCPTVYELPDRSRGNSPRRYQWTLSFLVVFKVTPTLSGMFLVRPPPTISYGRPSGMDLRESKLLSFKTMKGGP